MGVNMPPVVGLFLSKEKYRIFNMRRRERERERERERDRERQRETETDRQTDRQRQRHRERERDWRVCTFVDQAELKKTTTKRSVTVHPVSTGSLTHRSCFH